MTTTESAGPDNALVDALIGTRKLFQPRARITEDNREIHRQGGRESDAFYRNRWSHDKVVRSTHGVNCTGSCSWKVYVKDGIITWESQQTDYPTAGADLPEYEPRGCPRGASFSWYTYSPTRVRYPYVRAELLRQFRESKKRLGDPVDAWAAVVADRAGAARYKAQRGKGGLVRARWEEVTEIIAAAYVHTIKEYGPDRIAGFSPIPAMSQISFSSGARFHQLIGGPMLSFYDWYADLPPASPQVFGDQTDVPESGDWWNAAYLMMWGSNVPLTRTPDAHWMTEARYRGQKVIAVAPDYAENVKFADEWLRPHPGTDAALALGMGHTILKEFYVENPNEYFVSYAKQYTDLPFLVEVSRDDAGAYRPGKFVVAADLDPAAVPEQASEHADFKPVMMDTRTNAPVVPPGTLGHRFNDEGIGRWHLDLGGIEPALSLLDSTADTADTADTVEILMPRFDTTGQGGRGDVVRGVPVRRLGERLVTTVYDLMLATFGVGRPGMPGEWARGLDDADALYTPAWQEAITGVPGGICARIGREFAQNAIDSGGRSMIIMGAGTNHWFHSDLIYRAFLTLTTLCGTQGVNGGGWAHYVGQEKVRPLTGWAHLANALDWSRPPRQMTQTTYWYMHTDQWRYDQFGADTLAATTGAGSFADMTTADAVALSARLGWQPFFPQFDVNPLEIADRAAAAERPTVEYLVDQLKSGGINFAVEDPDAEQNFPRIWSIWRANTLGSSAKGDQYFFKHLLGVDNTVGAEETAPQFRPKDVRWREEGPTGKTDLVLTLDFRMTTHTLHSDIILPAATWYEKYDLNTTDMHPFIHSFNPAISTPWQSRTDWQTWATIAEKFSELAATHLGVRTDVVAAPLQHDSIGALATPRGRVRDWKKGECEPIPGITLPNLVEVERDYAAVYDKYVSVGPLLEKLGMTTKGLTFDVRKYVDELRGLNGVVASGVGAGQPRLTDDLHACEFILRLSGTTNGEMATDGFKTLEKRTGHLMHDLAAEHEGKKIAFSDTQNAPVPVITSPEWSGSEAGGRRYSPFTINVERKKPWHTLTGRQHFYLDHDWMLEMGEELPAFRPPLDMTALFGEPAIGDGNAQTGISVRYLTPHQKWAIHSMYQENFFMMNLSRGGQTIWMSVEDAEAVGIADNDWIEATNRNGVVSARAIVSHRMPKGTAFMYHAQDRTVNTPISETSGQRGGIHNSLTRIMLKPSHLIGGYAQLAFAFNYYGPTGNQRDEVTVIRKRTSPVTY
ncbi:nitrate reductase subunit alpha [Pseudactinotalea sp. HY158]|uniref:nitrate reductase subunit alpha n=1 Tax=Pseudactinotalea sp. HY158 TaxID=2654547 RepID=UPI00129CA7F2|nr:nitrate reductase subunit alpha [Pseudactinotalea sp. HY158]QGH68241.1 nitrate reductase subunit alpha [Pseudactinotalea sp. HY158]